MNKLAKELLIGLGVNALTFAAIGSMDLVRKVKYKRYVKKGLKKGSVVKIDGEYYEVENMNVEEA